MLGGGADLLVVRLAAMIAIAGATVVISGSSAPGQAVVPDVVGMPVHLAYNAVQEAGFAVQIEEPIELSSYVSRQSRPAGTTGHAGTAVRLSLREEWFGGILQPRGRSRVPRVVGKRLPDAIYALATQELAWAAAALPPLPATMRPTLFDNYRVAKQRPKPGTQFTQTVYRKLAGGSIAEETTTVGLVAELDTR
jgi:beta-lactam-binding protein with PASTA domain